MWYFGESIPRRHVQEITVIGALTDEGVEHFTVFKVTHYFGLTNLWSVVCLFVWVRDMNCECLASCVCHVVSFEDVLSV